MTKKQIITQLLDCQTDADRMVHENYHRLAQELGLTLEQFHLLLELDELMLDVQNTADAPTVGMLAKSIRVSQNTVSERVSRLEKKNLVCRKPDPKDRRISHVVLTQEGRSLLQRISAQAETSFVRHAMEQMETEELQTFLVCAQKLVSSMNQLNSKKEGNYK